MQMVVEEGGLSKRIDADLEVLVRAKTVVGEGPVWRDETSTLLWVDIPRGELHEVAVDSGSTRVRTIPESLGAVALTTSDELLLACASGFGLLAEDGFTITAALLDGSRRMNDAKCDPAGRFWAGSTTLDFQPGQGALHLLEPDGSHRVAVEGLTLPNGLDWSPDGTVFYLADTMRHEISAWDVDLTDGTLRDRRLFASFGNGMPDGLTVDTDGCLWVTMWGGAELRRLAPDGRTVATVPMPVAQPSSCTFGGADLTTLFVTSARDGLPVGPAALDGSVFALHGLGAQGLPTARFGVGRIG
jgi:sugar lactone lactonase YvrE